MKKSELIFTFLLLPLDFCMILLAAISAYHLRFAEFTADIRPIIFNLPFDYYFNAALLVSAGCVIIFAFAGLYNITAATKITDEFYRLVLACSTGLVAVIILMFFQRELFSSRFIILAAWVLAIIYTAVARFLMRVIQRHIYAQGIGVHRIAVVGDTPATDRLITLISSSRKIGYKIIKRFKSVDSGILDELRTLARQGNIDEIMQVDPNLSRADVLNLFNICDEFHLTFKYAADLLGTKILKTDVSMLYGLPIVEVKITSLDGWGRILKRILDIIVSLLLIIIFSPIFLITAIIIKLESKGPVIYKNERVSRNGIFKTYKFRSMQLRYCIGEEYKNNNEALRVEEDLIQSQNTKTGPLYKISNDPRLTKTGRFIRRWSIDELPQFFNVLFGSMSIVGPRPHQPREVSRYERHHKKVLAVKPGLTGLAQISGRSDLSFEEEVKLDTYYIENWSPWIDFIIMLRTPLAVMRSRKVE